jgi:hypothetical protein
LFGVILKQITKNAEKMNLVENGDNVHKLRLAREKLTAAEPEHAEPVSDLVVT